jgi:hypothetical protein
MITVLICTCLQMNQVFDCNQNQIIQNKTGYTTITAIITYNIIYI